MRHAARSRIRGTGGARLDRNRRPPSLLECKRDVSIACSKIEDGPVGWRIPLDGGEDNLVPVWKPEGRVLEAHAGVVAVHRKRRAHVFRGQPIPGRVADWNGRE